MISEGKPVVWLFLYIRYLKEREGIKLVNYCTGFYKCQDRKHAYVLFKIARKRDSFCRFIHYFHLEWRGNHTILKSTPVCNLAWQRLFFCYGFAQCSSPESGGLHTCTPWDAPSTLPSTGLRVKARTSTCLGGE